MSSGSSRSLVLSYSSHGMTRCPDGVCTIGSSLVPGDHSILYPPGPGSAIISRPSRNTSTVSFCCIELNPNIAGKFAADPVAIVA